MPADEMLADAKWRKCELVIGGHPDWREKKCYLGIYQLR
jgi:hypothetical protein